MISKLLSDFDTRAAYINSKVSTLVPSQIRGLRLKSGTPRQPDLARAAKMHQSRISMLETAGANPTLATLGEVAAALKVGLKVEFVSFSEMLEWENSFSQDQVDVTTLDNDTAFINPSTTVPTYLANMVQEVPNVSWLSLDVLNDLTRMDVTEFLISTTSRIPDLRYRKLGEIERKWQNLVFGNTEPKTNTINMFKRSYEALPAEQPSTYMETARA